MSGKIKIGVAGASGRMGQMLIKSLILDDRFLLSGVLENSGHDWLGLDVGEMTGGKSFGLSVSDDPLGYFQKFKHLLILRLHQQVLDTLILQLKLDVFMLSEQQGFRKNIFKN